MAKNIANIDVKRIPCSATEFCSDYHYSTEWGNRLVDIWIAARKSSVAEGGLTAEVFRKELQLQILKAMEIEDAFVDGCREIGINADMDSKLFYDYEQYQIENAFNLIPSNLHAELCWVPEWDGVSIDTMLEVVGMKSEKWRSSFIEDVIPDKWLEIFLNLVNCSSVDLVAKAIELNSETGHAFAEKVAKANFKVVKDQNRIQILTPEQVLSAIENAYGFSVPMCHWEVNLKALFAFDPNKPMRMQTVKGEVHVGFHQVISGAGYMDTYAGDVIVPADATGFGGANRWSYGINKTYGIVKSHFYTTPKAV